MSETSAFTRRDFLKLVGIGAAGATSGCASRPAERLIPYLVPPKDILPGIPYWYASTCRECPSACGILVKTREGRAIKIEGNPQHPVNHGGLCARGHAALQGLYNPDRIATPRVKQGSAWKNLTWDEALKLASDKLGEAHRNQRGIVVVTDHAPGSFEKLVGAWAADLGATRVVYEPFAPHALIEANRRTFGQAAVPSYDFERARFVISFGADFLETWLSPAAFARGFSAMRAQGSGGYFVAVEPRLSLTGSNADEWLAVRPGTEMAIALGMVHVILAEGLGAGGGGGMRDAVASFTPEEVEQRTDVPAASLRRLAHAFAAARPGLAVAGGIASQSEQSVALLSAVNLLNSVAGNVGQTVRFDRTWNHDALGSFGELQTLATRMTGGGVDVLVVRGANPVYATPPWAGFAAAMDKVPFKISVGSVLDETAEHCDLLLPTTHDLETLGDAQAMRGVYSILQPTMKPLPMFDTRSAGDIFIAMARGAGSGAAFPATWVDYVKNEWRSLHPRFGHGTDFDAFWAQALEKGGVWEEPTGGGAPGWSGTPAFAIPELRGAGDFSLVVYPSATLYDGRGADKPWLQELPDPTTKAVWGSWVEIHPETAKRLGLRQGDGVKVETESGSVELPAYLYSGIRHDTIAIPLGQGHTASGRYAKDRGVNACALLPPAQDAASQAVAYLSARARVSKTARSIDLVVAQREKSQYEREFAQVIPLSALMGTASPGTAPQTAGGGHGAAPQGTGNVHDAGGGERPAGETHHAPDPSQTRPGVDTEPRRLRPNEKLPAHVVTAYEPVEQVRHPRAIPVTQGMYARAEHRWAMAIDLDRCTGCSACVTACYAENNIPAVGPEMIKRGREMAWLRIERFEERLGPKAGTGTDVRHLPMLCQHCGDAPCEIVCPVYATYHNPEGLNAQIYNRCVGTRYCSNNCPYKVRAFNWFDYTAPEKATFAFPEPLNWQLNPDVTVRSKGVMEKCTFCVQRILEGKGNAKDENRKIKDGEILTACQQSCPSEAIVFGDLLDPHSRVAQLSFSGERRYWALNELNTKPAVTYLKRVLRAEEASS